MTKSILEYAATGALFYVAASSPIGAQKINAEFSKYLKKQARYYFKKRIQDLQKHGYISLQGERVILTKKGSTVLSLAHVPDITIPTKKWKGVWQLVAYDIPDKKKMARDAFRRQLLAWGFVQVQKSVFAFPYECKEEVAVIAQEYRIAPHVLYMHSGDLPSLESLKRRFGLS